MFESGLASPAHSIAATEGWRVSPDFNNKRQNECLGALQKGREGRETREEIITEKEIEAGVVTMNSLLRFCLCFFLVYVGGVVCVCWAHAGFARWMLYNRSQAKQVGYLQVLTSTLHS